MPSQCRASAALVPICGRALAELRQNSPSCSRSEERPRRPCPKGSHRVVAFLPIKAVSFVQLARLLVCALQLRGKCSGKARVWGQCGVRAALVPSYRQISPQLPTSSCATFALLRRRVVCGVRRSGPEVVPGSGRPLGWVLHRVRTALATIRSIWGSAQRLSSPCRPNAPFPQGCSRGAATLSHRRVGTALSWCRASAALVPRCDRVLAELRQNSCGAPSRSPSPPPPPPPPPPSRFHGSPLRLRCFIWHLRRVGAELKPR